MNRRRFVRALGVSPLAAAAWSASSQAPVATALCAPGSEPLRVAGDAGWFARVAPAGAPLVMRAGDVDPSSGVPWTRAFSCEREGLLAYNPTLVARAGDRWRIELVNMLAQPTNVHWHGLRNDTRNDGPPMQLAAPGGRYAYDFVVRERAGLYWYHPHPHGVTARQTYEGLFGLIEVDDDDERALRKALDLEPGHTELTLVLQDRRGAGYTVDDVDRLHGRFGDTPLVNGCVEPYVDVRTRAYRLRIVNAANARTLRLGVRDAAGARVAMTLLGTDAGLVASPVRCDECFVSPAERVDLLVDFSRAAPGDSFILESGAFDPMHGETPAASTAAATAHAHQAGDGGHDAHARPPAASGWPEGARRTLATFRVRERVEWKRAVPSRLSSIPPIELGGARQRTFRLGFNKGRWHINDRVFAMNEAPIEVTRDSTEIWVLRNYHASMPHPMHLHGFHFQVIERETSPEQLAPLATHDGGRVATDLGWKDTVLVWPGESVRVAVRFALPFAGPQTYFLHCHNLEHEDGGMMLGVRVA